MIFSAPDARVSCDRCQSGWGRHAALEKAAALSAAIGEHPFPWQDENIPLTAAAGVSVLKDGAALETVMANVERNLADGEKRLKC